MNQVHKQRGSRPDNGYTGWQDAKTAFIAPRSPATSARLVFSAGAVGVNLRADPKLLDLCKAQFFRNIPSVRSQDNIVTIQYRNHSFLDWLASSLRTSLAEITLCSAPSWEIEVRGGVSRLTADLTRLCLTAFDINGGASEVSIALAQPSGWAYLRITGGASNVTLHHPPGAAMRVQVGSGASNLTLDGQYFAATSGPLTWGTPDYRQAASGYALEIVGGASNLTVATYA